MTGLIPDNDKTGLHCLLFVLIDKSKSSENT